MCTAAFVLAPQVEVQRPPDQRQKESHEKAKNRSMANTMNYLTTPQKSQDSDAVNTAFSQREFDRE